VIGLSLLSICKYSEIDSAFDWIFLYARLTSLGEPVVPEVERRTASSGNILSVINSSF
jgi:hypothetical protein